MAKSNEAKETVKVKGPAYKGTLPAQVGRALLRQRPDEKLAGGNDASEAILKGRRVADR